MIGLPEATLESDYLTALKALEMQPDVARIYPTLVIKNTKLEDMFLKGEYHALSIGEAVERTRKIYTLLELNGVNVIRVGLQPSEDLREDGVVLGGPFHPAFRELVETEIYYNFLKKIADREKKLDIETAEVNISKIVGIKKANRLRLKEYFNIKIDNSLSRDIVVVNGKIYSRVDILREENNESNSNQYRWLSI